MKKSKRSGEQRHSPQGTKDLGAADFLPRSRSSSLLHHYVRRIRSPFPVSRCVALPPRKAPGDFRNVAEKGVVTTRCSLEIPLRAWRLPRLRLSLPMTTPWPHAWTVTQGEPCLFQPRPYLHTRSSPFCSFRFPFFFVIDSVCYTGRGIIV